MQVWSGAEAVIAFFFSPLFSLFSLPLLLRSEEGWTGLIGRYRRRGGSAEGKKGHKKRKLQPFWKKGKALSGRVSLSLFRLCLIHTRTRADGGKSLLIHKVPPPTLVPFLLFSSAIPLFSSQPLALCVSPPPDGSLPTAPGSRHCVCVW